MKSRMNWRARDRYFSARSGSVFAASWALADVWIWAHLGVDELGELDCETAGIVVQLVDALRSVSRPPSRTDLVVPNWRVRRELELLQPGEITRHLRRVMEFRADLSEREIRKHPEPEPVRCGSANPSCVFSVADATHCQAWVSRCTSRGTPRCWPSLAATGTYRTRPAASRLRSSTGSSPPSAGLWPSRRPSIPRSRGPSHSPNHARTCSQRYPFDAAHRSVS